MDDNQEVSNRYSIAEAVKKVTDYRPASSNADLKEEKKTVKLSELELKLEEVSPEKKDMDPKVNSAEYFLAEQAYLSSTSSLDYNQSLMGEGSTTKKAEAEEYVSSMTATDTGSEMLTTKEAERAHTRMQYAAITGAVDEVSYIDRQKYSMWIKFNRALFGAFESQSVTRNVNFGAY